MKTTNGEFLLTIIDKYVDHMMEQTGGKIETIELMMQIVDACVDVNVDQINSVMNAGMKMDAADIAALKFGTHLLLLQKACHELKRHAMMEGTTGAVN